MDYNKNNKNVGLIFLSKIFLLLFSFALIVMLSFNPLIETTTFVILLTMYLIVLTYFIVNNSIILMLKVFIQCFLNRDKNPTENGEYVLLYSTNTKSIDIDIFSYSIETNKYTLLNNNLETFKVLGWYKI